MEFRPFGVNPNGEKILDVSGVTVRANVNYLEEVVGQAQGKEAGERAVKELCQLLNTRIQDSTYHVSPSFLKNVWNSYSYEFVCYLAEFCAALSKDPQFQFHMGKNKFISPIIQTLGRPFPVPQIYKMFPHFGEKFAKGSIRFSVGLVTNSSAVLRMKFTDQVYRQFGPYRKRCAELICDSAKAGLAAVPDQIHHLEFATIQDLQCIANGDEFCEWEFRWPPQTLRDHLFWPVAALVTGSATFGYLRGGHPDFLLAEALVLALFPAVACWFAGHLNRLQKKMTTREELIKEQVLFVETRHEELRKAYLEQERTSVELRRKVGQLTTLHRAGLLFISTLDREAVLQKVLETIIHELHYDRVMLAFYDPRRQVSYDARILGGPQEIAAFAGALETPITDPDTIEGKVLLQGLPLLIGDLRKEWDRLHPNNQQLASMANAKSIISVPLKVKDVVIGSLTVDRSQEYALTQDDLNVMATVANQVAIALDNAQIYHQIEELNVGLEKRVQERTMELQAANEKLQELDRLKTAFVSMVSHELRTPMTSVKGLVENMLDGLTGTLNDRQSFYLNRVRHNIARLSRMITDLLDLSRIEAGRMDLSLAPVSMVDLVVEATENLRPAALEKSITLQSRYDGGLPTIQGDRDKILQILTNLLHNAIKFTSPGGKIHVDLVRRENECLQVCVMDTGCGIPLNEVTTIFEQFYRGQAGPLEARGAGLGLAITKNLVELHKGQIWAESQLGEGSRFFFTLPLDSSPS